MKVLAIIPACEVSKELPNKNLRVIKGIPMICYTIRNALSSRYITDVIVSSNSKELLSIARQMGAITRADIEPCARRILSTILKFD